MTKGLPLLPGRTREGLRRWAYARRFAVPRSMIERAAEAREAGDWRQACAASNVEVRFAVADVARECGDAIAEQLESDLVGLAPDLIRWHLPRDGVEMLVTDVTCILARYGDAADSPCLTVRLVPATGMFQRQRLQLGFGPFRHVPQYPTKRLWWTALRHLWDARHSHDLLRWCGGDDRAPFFEADGTPRPLTTTDPGPSGDMAARTEYSAALHQARDLRGAVAAAGLQLTASSEDRWWIRNGLGTFPLAPTQWAIAMDALRPVSDTWYVRNGYDFLLLDGSQPGTVGVQTVTVDEKHDFSMRRTGGNERLWRRLPVLPEAAWQRPVDLDLVAAGQLTPEDLHPLVRNALFPKRSTMDHPVGPPAPATPQRVRVRCHGRTHILSPEGGTLRLLSHTDTEVVREEAMTALGGAQRAGCFAVREAWVAGDGPALPRGLRTQRDELFARMRHDDVAGVAAMLAAGFDPAAVDDQGGTLLHHMMTVDHERLLPKVLAAGIDVTARNHRKRTALQWAIEYQAPPTLVRALIAAGGAATPDGWNRVTPGMVHQYRDVDPDFVAWLRVQAGFDPATPRRTE